MAELIVAITSQANNDGQKLEGIVFKPIVMISNFDRIEKFYKGAKDPNHFVIKTSLSPLGLVDQLCKKELVESGFCVGNISSLFSVEKERRDELVKRLENEEFKEKTVSQSGHRQFWMME